MRVSLQRIFQVLCYRSLIVKVNKILSKLIASEQFMFLIVINVHVVVFQAYFVNWCTYMYWVWVMGGMNSSYETKLWVWLPLQISIPWSFDDNNQYDYVKSQASNCVKNWASKKVWNNPTYSWMCNCCLQIRHTCLVLHDYAIFVYSF
jgi:hypothetical protein